MSEQMEADATNVLSTSLHLPPGVWAVIVQHAGPLGLWRTCNALCRASRAALTDVIHLGEETAQDADSPLGLAIDLDALADHGSIMPLAARAAMLARFGERFAAIRRLHLGVHYVEDGIDGAVGAALFHDFAAQHMSRVESLTVIGSQRVPSHALYLLPSATFGPTVRHLSISMHITCLQALGEAASRWFPALTSLELEILSWDLKDGDEYVDCESYRMTVCLPAALRELSIHGHELMDYMSGDVGNRPYPLHLNLNGPGARSLQRLVLAPQRNDDEARAWPCLLYGAPLPALEELDACLGAALFPRLQQICPALACLRSRRAPGTLHMLPGILQQLSANLQQLHFYIGNGTPQMALDFMLGKMRPQVAAALPSTQFFVWA